MTWSISRMYASSAQAARAVEGLKNSDHVFNDIYMVSRPEGAPTDDNTRNAIIRSLTSHYVWLPHARIYADGINKGGTLVTVHAPFGSSVEAKTILDSHQPIDSGVSDHKPKSVAWDERTPVSSMLQMPALSKTKTPFEVVCNVASVLTSAPKMTSGFMPLLSRKPTPLSGAMGLPMQAKSATPLSSKLGLPTLSRKPR